MTDCLIIGFNDQDFPGYVDSVRSMGKESGAYRDLNLAFIDVDGKPRRSLDVLSAFRCRELGEKPYFNTDFLWPTITYLGSFLERHGFTFDYVNHFQFEKDKLRQKLLAGDIGTVAITTTLYVTPAPILEIISFIKQYNDQALILVGGPFIANQATSSEPEDMQELYQYLGADIYVDSNEGESALVQILQTMKDGGDLAEVDNIAYRNGSGFAINPRLPESNPLDENPIDYNLFPAAEIGQFVSLRTAKSCPFSCAFCGFPQRAGKYVYLSVDDVEKELDALRDLETVTTLSFLDDTFNVPKRRFKELLRMMIRKDYGFRWNSFYRSDHGDEETIELMAAAGCEGVFLGVESGSDTMLEYMNKTARRKHYLKAIPRLREAGISMYASLIVGYPGETYATVQETIDFIEEARPDFYRAQLWYADPITPVWQRREEFAIEGEAFNWSHRTMDCHIACDLIERMFMTIEGSLWMPQFGFEQWSTFYLQRRGMAMAEVKAFVRTFNEAVKEKMLYPAKSEVRPRLLAPLERRSLFERHPLAEDELEILSTPAEYTAAETFWVHEFSDPVRSNLSEVERATPADGASRKLLEVDGGEALTRFVDRFADLWPQAALAVWSVLLSRLNGLEDTALAVALAGAEPIPLRLRPAADTHFATFVDETREQVARAHSLSHYGFHFLTNRVRMTRFGATLPTFDVGFLHRQHGTADIADLRALVPGFPAIGENLDLLLITSQAETPRWSLSYAHRRLSRQTVAELARLLRAAVEEATRDPRAPIATLLASQRGIEASPRAAVEDAEEAFHF